MIDIENQDEIYGWSIEQLWNAFTHIESDPEYEEEVEKVKYGTIIKIHIQYFIKKLIKEYPDTETAEIPNKRPINIEQVWDEENERKKVMREIILRELEKEESPLKPRT